MPISIEQFEQQRPWLFGIAYRMLGSASEAEDVVQDAYLRASSTLTEIASVRAFLATIVTRLCLDQLKAARHLREQYIGTWLPEPILARPEGEANAERSELLAMAMLVLLETLSPLERAVFVLREAFEYPFNEIGAMVGRSAAACRQAHHRARIHLQAQVPRFQPSPEQQQRLVQAFLLATRDGDLNRLTSLLTREVVAWGDGGGKAAAIRKAVYGPQAVARLIHGLTLRLQQTADVRIELAWINAAPGVQIWQGRQLISVLVFACDDTGISAIYLLRNPDKLAHLAATSTPAG